MDFDKSSSPTRGDLSRSSSNTSIYDYQTRYPNNRNSGIVPSGSFPHVQTSSGSPARVNSLREDTSVNGLRRSASGARIGLGHGRGKSVDLVRGKFEAKIEASRNEPQTPVPRHRPHSVIGASSGSQMSSLSTRMSSLGLNPPTDPSARIRPTVVDAERLGRSTTATNNAEAVAQPSLGQMKSSPQPVIASSKPYSLEAATRGSSLVQPDAEPRPTNPNSAVSGQAIEAQKSHSSQAEAESHVEPRLGHGHRPESISSFRALSSNNTGSTVGSVRGHRPPAVALAEARANALRRLEAKNRSAATSSETETGVAVKPQPMIESRALQEKPVTVAVSAQVSQQHPPVSLTPINKTETVTTCQAGPDVPPPNALTTILATSASPTTSLADSPVSPDSLEPKEAQVQPTISGFGQHLIPPTRPVEGTIMRGKNGKSLESPFGERLRATPRPQERGATGSGKIDFPTLRKVDSRGPPPSVNARVELPTLRKVGTPSTTLNEIKAKMDEPRSLAHSVKPTGSSGMSESKPNHPSPRAEPQASSSNFANDNSDKAPVLGKVGAATPSRLLPRAAGSPSTRLIAKSPKTMEPGTPPVSRPESPARLGRLGDRPCSPLREGLPEAPSKLTPKPQLSPTKVSPKASPKKSDVSRDVDGHSSSASVASVSDTPRPTSSRPGATPANSSTVSADNDLFLPPKANLVDTAVPVSNPLPKPKFAGLSYRAPTGPPKGTVSSLAMKFAPGGSSTPQRPRVPSLGTDRRRLGKHLPRIVSGDQGWEGDGSRRRESQSRKNRKSSLSNAIPQTEENTPPPVPPLPEGISISTPTRPSSTRNVEPFAPSSTHNRTESLSTRTPTTNKRLSSLSSETAKSGILGTLTTPLPEVAGVDMKGLMHAVAATPGRKANVDDGEGVTGMNTRLRLSERLPLAASSAAMAPAPLPSRRLANNNWMDRQRHALHAYEYLCHVGEAQQWIEGCLDEELEFGVTEMEEGLRDGVVLAKLSRVFQGEQVVRRIWTEAKHRYRQSDNINYFLHFIRTVGMPETFIFELTDLYNKRNVPKVIFCIHVLSHLLARLGRAERMNNLVGQFEFTDEQLAATQKGLEGVQLPNFQQVGQTLAKEASWEEPEPEEEEESEDERRDRELLECEGSITAFQCQLRGSLARQRASRVNTQLKLATPIIMQLQAQIRGSTTRKGMVDRKKGHDKLAGWAKSLQAASRTRIITGRYHQRVEQINSSHVNVVGMQAQARGLLVRMRRKSRNKEVARGHQAYVGIQAHARGMMARRQAKNRRDVVTHPVVAQSIVSAQSLLRGHLARQAVTRELRTVHAHVATFTNLQGQLRGALVRRRIRAHEQRMDDATTYIIAIQSQARGVLARRRKQVVAKAVATVSTSFVSLQALARARLAKRQHSNMQKALAKVEVAGSIGGLQAFLRTRLAKKHTVEQKKKLEFVQPDVVEFQAVARGYLARQEYREWRDYLVDPHTQGALVFLQSLIRGFLCRRRHWMHVSHLYRNVDSVVKLQSLARGLKHRKMYERLMTLHGVDVPTIQNYMHLLDRTESDFRDQYMIDQLHNEVLDLARQNQTLETEVQELDTKIALVVKNKMTFEDLVRAKRRHGPVDETFLHPGSNDPFVGVQLDRASQRKLELYEHLFFTLQTQPQYFSRLLHKLSTDLEADSDKRFLEGVILTLFGFGQDHRRREEDLFKKLIQITVHEQVLYSHSLEELAKTKFAITPVILKYARPQLTPYLQNTLYDHIARIVSPESVQLDLSTDPVEIYNLILNNEEALTGIKTTLPRNLTADEVLGGHTETRTVYIQHLQELRKFTEDISTALRSSTAQMPYLIRLLARETMLALRIRFNIPDYELWPVVARVAILPFILPAIVAPENYGLTSSVNALQRRNLDAIAKLLVHAATPYVADPTEDRLVRVPLGQYIEMEGGNILNWAVDVAEVDFQVQEWLESTSDASPVQITRNDIYGTLSLLLKNIPVLTAGKTGDPIEGVLNELEGPPLDYDRGDTKVRLKLTNRLANLPPSDPHQAQLQELEKQAKRHVIAVLRVQTGKDLFEVLLNHPTEDDEQRWIQEVHRDIELEQARRDQNVMPSGPGERQYEIEDIRSLTFQEVKSRAIDFSMRLAEVGKISRENKYQELLTLIATDIKEKNRLRQKRKLDLQSLVEAHQQQTQKRGGFEDQIQSYHDYIDSAMSSLQQKKKAPLFSRQYWHQKGTGNKAQFGSYKYTAKVLYERGILLSVSQFSPRQFDKLIIVISSDEVGVFTLDMSHPSAAQHEGLVGHEEVRMEDLLQAQFDNNTRLDLFEGQALFNLNMLVHHINKKFYTK